MAMLLVLLPIVAGTYTKELIALPVSRGQVAEAYLLRPDSVPPGGCPAIVALHDHGARFTIGKEKLCFPLDTALQAEATAWVEKFYDGAFVADTLASRGYVVLVADALYWGSRRPNRTQTNKELKLSQPDYYEAYLAKTGVPWFETILQDDKAAVDYLIRLPEVDSLRIGAWGFSMGAYRAWQLGAEDARIAYVAAANWMTTLVAAETGVSSYSMLRPAMAGIEYGDIAARIAPRPLLLQYGDADHLFPYGEHIRRPWPALTIEVLPGAHRFTRQHLNSLLGWLSNR